MKRGRAAHVGRFARAALAIALCLQVGLAGASAAELWSDEEGQDSVSLDVAAKASALASYAPYDPILFADRHSEVALFRLRFDLSAKHSDWLDAELAYEHSASLSSGAGGSGAGSGILPSSARAPFRIAQLDAEVVDATSSFTWRHELDRALVALHPEWGEVTVGRQAIGLGRGVIFSAVDVFSPFSPLEVDREWRRGVDAARIEYRLSPTTSAEVIGAAGESWEESALLGRVRGYLGDFDAELIAGKRAGDAMYGAVASTIVGGAEVHSELAVFHTPEAQPDRGLLGSRHLVPKAVLGSSYVFDVGNGLTVLGEYHYSGFGVKRAEDITDRLADPAFQKRYLRGDTQILGRHAAAFQASYPISDDWSGSLLFLASPRDGSGVASPSLSWDVMQNVTLSASCFLPWGAGPSGGKLRSEYGGSGASLFLQLSTYF